MEKIKKLILSLEENERIFCKNMDEVDKLFNLLNDLGLRWRSGAFFNDKKAQGYIMIEKQINFYNTPGVFIYPYNRTYDIRYETLFRRKDSTKRSLNFNSLYNTSSRFNNLLTQSIKNILL